MQAQAARARLPLGAGAVAAQAGKLLPVLAAIGRAEDSCVFHARVHRVRIGERRLQMPHPFELPGMLRAVVPLMSSERLRSRVIGELVALAFGRSGRCRLSSGCSRLVPGFAAIIGALNDLTEPAAALRRINTIRIGRRSFEVIHLPARKVGAADIPFLALAVRRQHECAFLGPYQYSYLAHSALLPERETVHSLLVKCKLKYATVEICPSANPGGGQSAH